MIDEQWWGHSKEHGWVVLDRNLAPNRSGQRSELRFLRCKDQQTFMLKREKWDKPAYVYAPNYLRTLGEDESAFAATELSALKDRWPEMEKALHEQFPDTPKPAEAAANAATDAAVVKKPAKRAAKTTGKKAKAPVSD